MGKEEGNLGGFLLRRRRQRAASRVVGETGQGRRRDRVRGEEE